MQWNGFFISIFFLISTSALAQGPQWYDLARRLNGESQEVHHRMRQSLESRKNLEDELKMALGGPHHALALDTITTLKKRNFIPLLKIWAEKDKDGLSLLALNVMIETKNQKEILDLEKNWLLHRGSHLSPAQIIVLFDLLGRAQVTFQPKDIQAYFSHPYYEVQQSVLFYLFHTWKKYGEKNTKKMLAWSLQTHSIQLKQQLVALRKDWTPFATQITQSLCPKLKESPPCKRDNQ